jgi:seryl-tRNA synthetase
MSGARRVFVKAPPDVRWDPAIQKSVHESLPYYVEGFKDAAFSDAGIHIDLATTADEKKIQAVTGDLIELVARTHRDIADRIIKASGSPAKLVNDDPFAHFLARRDIVSTGRGKFVYAGDFLKVFNALDQHLLEFALTLGAREELYPSTVQAESLLNSGYLKQSPHLSFFVAPVNFAKDSLTAMGDAAILSHDCRLDTVSHLGVPDQILSPTVCYHCFEARKGRAQAQGMVTAINKCYRHEPVAVQSLERLTTYWMREIIMFGTGDYVAQSLEKVSDFAVTLMESLGCQYELTTASDPFFSDMASGKRMFQAVFDLKRELKSKVYGGKDVAFASFNNHQKSLVESFGITSRDRELTSGCVGFGMERMLYALFSQLGTDVGKWPARAKTTLGLS